MKSVNTQGIVFITHYCVGFQKLTIHCFSHFGWEIRSVSGIQKCRSREVFNNKDKEGIIPFLARTVSLRKLSVLRSVGFGKLHCISIYESVLEPKNKLPCLWHRYRASGIIFSFTFRCSHKGTAQPLREVSETLPIVLHMEYAGTGGLCYFYISPM